MVRFFRKANEIRNSDFIGLFLLVNSRFHKIYSKFNTLVVPKALKKYSQKTDEVSNEVRLSAVSFCAFAANGESRWGFCASSADECRAFPTLLALFMSWRKTRRVRTERTTRI
jgi:hypothetical protein